MTKYKYVTTGYSALDNLMNPYWTWVVELVPMTVAPNTLTLVGLIINASAYAIMFYYD